jgi:tetratricopeptide (TPR) repeat protein
VRSQLAEGPVLAGQIPPVTGRYVPRNETGLPLASLAADETTVLVPAEDPASGLAWLGGNGKTTLAAALAQASWDSAAAGLVVWITVTGRDAVLAGYAQALRELDLVRHKEGSAELLADRFLDWLEKADLPWLVVLDDVADPVALDGLWPRLGNGALGRVLVTARQSDAAVAAHRPRLAGLGAFSPREALDCVSTRLDLGPGQRAGALDLAGDLGFGPLPLGLASAFMARTGLDCREYRARFTERRQMLAHAFPDGFSLAAATAWSLAVELADQIPPRGLAARILVLLSMLTPHGIPGAVLASEAARAYLAGGVPVDMGEVRAAVRNLAGANLVTVDDDSPARTLRVHEALQVITRHHLPSAEFRKAALAGADAVAQAWQSGDLTPPAAQALRDCTATLDRIAGADLWTPQCHPALLQAGYSLDAEGLTGPAAAYWQAMLGASQQALGDEHPQTGGLRDLLGSAQAAAGHVEDAVALHEAALVEAERVLGPGHPDTRPARERLTSSYLSAGRKPEAIHLAETFFTGCRQNLGPDHAETLGAQANLAGVYLAAGQPGEATAALEDLAGRQDRLLGPGHPDAIVARARLIDAYRDSGRFKDAIALGKRTVADLEAGLGADHPDTIAARASLASAYRSAKKPKDALKLYERVLEDRERWQGPDHRDTILARSDLALACLSTRKLAVAIAQYERALADSASVLGEHHPVTEAVRESLREAAAYARSVGGIDLRSATR